MCDYFDWDDDDKKLMISLRYCSHEICVALTQPTYCQELTKGTLISILAKGHFAPKELEGIIADDDPSRLQLIIQREHVEDKKRLEAIELIDEDFNVFQNAVEKNSFGEENFQNALYHCFSYSANEIDCTAFVNLYAKFGIIAMKLVNMLESSKNSYDDHMRNYFDDTKRISDQDVIENLSSDHNYIDELDKNHFFQYLLNLSCAKRHNHRYRK
ncbi:unnamed protein product [Rotaria sordida]|uniref:Uncharacterized protein n=1 Tax=Rotaria sordida TaxID=392033 RepID=A0A814T778_9BILA|nr:unnamed protein product [Rotaria sordida]